MVLKIFVISFFYKRVVTQALQLPWTMTEQISFRWKGNLLVQLLTYKTVHLFY